MRALGIGVVVAAASSCAPSLLDDFPFDGQVNSGPLVEVAVGDDGVRTAVIDATNKGSQVYVDLDGDQELKAEEAFSTNGWDLAFQRYKVTSNGGSGNPQGEVAVAVLTQVPFAELTVAPSDGYHQDGTDPVFNGEHGGWYNYDLNVHKLLPRDLLYVVKTSSGRYMKVSMVSYYDGSGTPARLTMLYALLQPPVVQP